MVERIRNEVRRVFTGEFGGRRMSQSELDAYRRQLVLFGISVIAILLVVILAAGAYYQYIHLPRQTIAVVGDTDIKRNEYWGYRRYDLLNQINQYQQLAQFMGAEQGQQYQQMAFQAGQELQDVENRSIDPGSLNSMIDDAIIMDALDEFGLEITDDDIERFLIEYFTGQQLPGEVPGPTADPTAEAWATATAEAMQVDPEIEFDLETDPADPDAQRDDDEALDAADDADDENGPDDGAGDQDDEEVEQAPTPEPEPTPSAEELRATATAVQDQHEDNVLEVIGMSHDEFVEAIVKPRIAREKIREHLAADIPVRAEQVHAAHILVATEDAARLIYEELHEEDAPDFADVAEAQSTDTQTAPTGGDLGWFPRTVMVPEFDEVAFATPEGEISEPFQTDFGWHIIHVIERDDDRPIELSVLDRLRQRAFDDWLQERRAATEIDTRGVTLPSDAPTPPSQQFQPPPAAPEPPQPTPPPLPDDADIFGDDEPDDLFPDGDPFEDLDDD